MSERVSAPDSWEMGRLSSAALTLVRFTTAVWPVLENGVGWETIGDSAIVIVKFPRAMRQG